MERAEERVLSALAGLQGNPDWAVVKEWLIASQHADMAALYMARDDVSARWLQGSVQTLNQIVATSNRAMAVMHKRRTE